jgi:hypothetical protein
MQKNGDVEYVERNEERNKIKYNRKRGIFL